MEDKRDLSLRLYSVLETVGASEEMRRLHRDIATTLEILTTVENTITSDELYASYFCGSSYEGTVTPDLSSDIDIVNCDHNLPVVLDVQTSPSGPSYLMVRDSWTYPGYVKLQVVLDGHPWTANHGILINCKIDDAGRVCSKHSPLSNMNGPAIMHINDNGEHILDVVPAFKCDSIPPFALEWFLRTRPYGRPSQEQLQALSRMGCMVVGAGHVNSGEKDIEWRLSFSLQERLLMSGLNPVQHKVYVLLKMIKKNILAEVFNDETLTSYHCKTCVLFTVQMTPERAWTGENLINCLLQCLKLLIKWIEQGNCSNYFVKNQNLFVREGFPRLRTRLLRVMRLVLETDTKFLYMIQSDNVGDILRNGDWRLHREITSGKKNDHIVKLKILCVQVTNCVAFHLIQRMRGGCCDPVTLASALDALQRTETITEHTVEDTQSSLAYLCPWFHLHIAKGLVCLTYRYPDRADHRQMMEMADFHFNEARGSDLVNERLARASVLYKSEHYDECFLLLEQIENEFIRHVVLYCLCTGKCAVTSYDIRDAHERNRKIANVTMRQFITTLTACCVVFLPSQLEITPVPLQYEMQRSLGTLPGSRSELFNFWFDWAVVDAKVYLYFMQYLVSSKLHKEAHKQVAMDNLRAEIVSDDLRVMTGSGRKSKLAHTETAYNLLGWIYTQEGRFAEAFRCFTESWKIRPFHNAAKFHMRDLVGRLSERHE